MEFEAFAIISAFIIIFGLISGRIQQTIFTGPMVFVIFGYLLSESVLDMVHIEVEGELINMLAEITLVLVLFTDASRIRLGLLLKQYDLPLRMLVVGLPLTIAAGTIAAVLIFTELAFWEAALIAVILAPTDAALAQAVLNSERVPVRIRQTINVESGLNDGLALPVLLLFISLAIEASRSTSYWAEFIGLQLVLGPLIGFAVGYIGGNAVSWTTKNGWMDDAFQRLSAIGLAIMAYAFAELIGGNGFVAAFVAGLTVGNAAHAICHCLYEFAEAEGQLLMLLTFMVFGAVFVPPALEHFQPEMLVYAILSLTLVRMIPMAISLFDKKLQPATILFLGWFGPRGIASIIYGLILLEQENLAAGELLFNIMVITALLSVFVHGFTAQPGVRLYVRRLKAAEDGDEMPEEMVVEEMPMRRM